MMRHRCTAIAPAGRSAIGSSPMDSRRQHLAGDKAFVDNAGKGGPIVDPATGEVCLAEIFVSVLGASNLTYVEAAWTQSLSDWTDAHVRMAQAAAQPRL